MTRALMYTQRDNMSVCVAHNVHLSSKLKNTVMVGPDKALIPGHMDTCSKTHTVRMHSEGYCSWVCMSVCLSVKSHLAYGVSVCPEIGHVLNGQQICGVFSETALLQRFSTPSVVRP